MFAFIKKIIFNKLFNEKAKFPQKTDSLWGAGLMRIAKRNYKPLIKNDGMFVDCAQSFITEAIRYSLAYIYEQKRSPSTPAVAAEGSFVIWCTDSENMMALTFLKEIKKILENKP